ncbi:MAG: PhoX family protein, partial [Chloroflexi bacterium]|nr:PhoX family protein [Chloroflexota bacterium]
MLRVPKRSALSVLAVLILLVLTVGAVLAQSITGPSSSQTPYLVRSIPGVVVKAILTTGDSVNLKPDGTPYRMVGIPDGLGAFDNGDGTFTVLMNHELGESLGIVRAHGATGAFVSKWIVEKESLRVLHGEDLIQTVGVWDGTAWQYQSGVAISRLCSADLPPLSAFFNANTGNGYNGRLFMNGEEAGAEGMGYAHGLDGVSYQLPWLGRFSWENNVAHPNAGDNTVVIGLDDSGDGQVYVYVGSKQATGTPAELAGLTNGVLYGLKVNGYPFEDPAGGIPSGTSFTGYSFGDVSAWTGAFLQDESRANGVTEFQRPEDGAWDPNNPNDFYFVTTASFSGNSRLWRIRFADPTNPALGGTIDMLLDGAEGHRMMDNLAINGRGQVFIQEDPGNNSWLAKIWRYDIAGDSLLEVAAHDPDRFLAGAPGFLTTNEEAS